jgi:GTP-binding protein
MSSRAALCKQAKLSMHSVDHAPSPVNYCHAELSFMLPGFENFDLTQAAFVKEAHLISQLPFDEGAEIAIAGRSNAGKSSVINALCSRRKLARTSRTPGRTQHFVVYEFAPDRRVIDLPGFGFAKVSKSKRDHWGHEIPLYLETRQSLIGLVLVVDSRHPLKTQELEILNWCRDADLALLLLLNKCDKLNQRDAASAVRQIEALISSAGTKFSTQLFSATTKRGIDTATKRLADWFKGGPEVKKKAPVGK